MKRRHTVAIALSLTAIFCGLQYRIWYGPDSFPAGYALEAKIAEQTKENLLLHQRNDQAYAEVLELKSGLETVEERARNDLGMVKSGETLYLLPNPEYPH